MAQLENDCENQFSTEKKTMQIKQELDNECNNVEMPDGATLAIKKEELDIPCDCTGHGDTCNSKHTAENDNTFKCGVCHKQYTAELEFEVHKSVCGDESAVHDENTEPENLQPIEFVDVKDLIDRDDETNKAELFKCEHCGEKFKHERDNLQHVCAVNANKFAPGLLVLQLVQKRENVEQLKPSDPACSQLTEKQQKTRERWRCFVPGCSSSCTDYPKKFFFSIPSKPLLRSKWIEAARQNKTITPIGLLTNAYCCSDHFDLEKDIENYRRWRFMVDRGMKTKTFMKPGVVPHIFECQNKPPQTNTRNIQEEKEKRKKIVQKLLEEEEESALELKNEITVTEKPTEPAFMFPICNLRDKCCQVKIRLPFRSKAVQVKPQTCSVGTSRPRLTKTYSIQRPGKRAKKTEKFLEVRRRSEPETAVKNEIIVNEESSEATLAWSGSLLDKCCQVEMRFPHRSQGVQVKPEMCTVATWKYAKNRKKGIVAADSSVINFLCPSSGTSKTDQEDPEIKRIKKKT